jgi:hypothetical protein
MKSHHQGPHPLVAPYVSPYRNTTVSRIPPTNLPYIKTAMMTFAPLSRENRSNRGGWFCFVRTNAQQEKVTVWMLGHKTFPVAMASLELSVK